MDFEDKKQQVKFLIQRYENSKQIFLQSIQQKKEVLQYKQDLQRAEEKIKQKSKSIKNLVKKEKTFQKIEDVQFQQPEQLIAKVNQMKQLYKKIQSQVQMNKPKDFMQKIQFANDLNKLKILNKYLIENITKILPQHLSKKRTIYNEKFQNLEKIKQYFQEIQKSCEMFINKHDSDQLLMQLKKQIKIKNLQLIFIKLLVIISVDLHRNFFFFFQGFFEVLYFLRKLLIQIQFFFDNFFSFVNILINVIIFHFVLSLLNNFTFLSQQLGIFFDDIKMHGQHLIMQVNNISDFFVKIHKIIIVILFLFFIAITFSFFFDSFFHVLQVIMQERSVLVFINGYRRLFVWLRKIFSLFFHLFLIIQRAIIFILLQQRNFFLLIIVFVVRTRFHS